MFKQDTLRNVNNHMIKIKANKKLVVINNLKANEACKYLLEFPYISYKKKLNTFIDFICTLVIAVRRTLTFIFTNLPM